MQEGFRSKEYGFYTSMLEEILPRVKKLINKCRDKGYRIIYLRYNLKGVKDVVNKSRHELKIFSKTSAVRICPEIKPEENDVIINKHTFSGFIKTRLRGVLNKKGIKRLIFSGVSTDACVRSTLYDAYDLGYHCIIVEDCIGSEPKHHRIVMEQFKTQLDKAEFKKLKDI